jgi:hypothetical protein
LAGSVAGPREARMVQGVASFESGAREVGAGRGQSGQETVG